MDATFDDIKAALLALDMPGEADAIRGWESLVRLKVMLGHRALEAHDPARWRAINKARDLVCVTLARLGVPPGTDWTSASIDEAKRAMATR